MKYDFLIVGAGLFGATFARLATDEGYRCLVIDKRNHIGGNCFTRKEGLIDIHEYGPHIFHTSNNAVWNFVNKYSSFQPFINSPKALYKGKLYSLPFNLQTFYELWGITDPEKAKDTIDKQRFRGKVNNLEEQALALVGTDIYNILIKGYTEKQWGKSAAELPSFIIKRLPLRFTFDTNYFTDTHQGIPTDGYTSMFDKLLEGIQVKLNVDFLQDKGFWLDLATAVVYTGCIDEFFNYELGKLEYRSLRFEHRRFEKPCYQGTPVINYTDKAVPFTRSVEHKFFKNVNTDYTVITREFPSDHTVNKVPFYPINSEANNMLYSKYRDKATSEKSIIFGGRLGTYRYLDMHVVIEQAMNSWASWKKTNVL